jgi:phosphatidylserine decarboxylase
VDLFLFKIAKEGIPYVFVFLALAVVFLVLGIKLPVVVFSVLTAFMLYFFRDPERTPKGEGYLSPADGKVIVVRKTFEGTYLNKEALQISIFMSPFDVHVNRAPCEGEVLLVKHTPGGFRAAYKEEAFLRNENTSMVIGCERGEVLLRQVAGFLARRTVCRKKQGDTLKRGERFGIIKFSSRVDVYLPLDTEPRVRVGDRVKAGESVIGL